MSHRARLIHRGVALVLFMRFMWIVFANLTNPLHQISSVEAIGWMIYFGGVFQLWTYEEFFGGRT